MRLDGPVYIMTYLFVLTHWFLNCVLKGKPPSVDHILLFEYNRINTWFIYIYIYIDTIEKIYLFLKCWLKLNVFPKLPALWLQLFILDPKSTKVLSEMCSSKNNNQMLNWEHETPASFVPVGKIFINIMNVDFVVWAHHIGKSEIWCCTWLILACLQLLSLQADLQPTLTLDSVFHLLSLMSVKLHPL